MIPRLGRRAMLKAHRGYLTPEEWDTNNQSLDIEAGSFYEDGPKKLTGFTGEIGDSELEKNFLMFKKSCSECLSRLEKSINPKERGKLLLRLQTNFNLADLILSNPELAFNPLYNKEVQELKDVYNKFTNQ